MQSKTEHESFLHKIEMKGRGASIRNCERLCNRDVNMTSKRRSSMKIYFSEPWGKEELGRGRSKHEEQEQNFFLNLF